MTNDHPMPQKYKIYDIHCGKCQHYLLTYHKYGAGKGILRLYLANIAAPTSYMNLHMSNHATIKAVPNLQCPSCSEVIGVPTVSKGQKWVYRMRQGFFHRKLKK